MSRLTTFGGGASGIGSLPSGSSSSIWDDDGDWEEMPVIKSTNLKTKEILQVADDDEDELASREHRKKKQQQRSARLKREREEEQRIEDDLARRASVAAGGGGNATGNLLDIDFEGTEWREKGEMEDEMDYTRLELDDDPEEDVLSMRTQYLFNQDKDMTPLAQMQATKDLLTEGQRIAYVGLCRLVTREMVQILSIASRGAKELVAPRDSCQNWASKIMGRLYRHMEILPDEQKMIELLAEHGVTADDLVPSLMTTYTVDNPEYDPELAAQEEEEQRQREEDEAAEKAEHDHEVQTDDKSRWQESDSIAQLTRRTSDLALDALGQSSLDDDVSPPARTDVPIIKEPPKEDDYDGGDLASALDAPPTPRAVPSDLQTPSTAPEVEATAEEKTPDAIDDLMSPMPSTLPGVSQSLSAADKTVTLDIRWTILCDLFLSLIADSVYDARSRVLLLNVAQRLGLDGVDLVRFERRLTEALEIQEAVKNKEHSEILEDVRLKGKKSRYVMMGLATLGGGLVIGLSAGLLAPVIGAGLGAALTTVGVSGTTGFLAGAGGAAIVTSTGTLTGSYIGGKAMAKRTRHVKVFEVLPIHNNKRVNFYVTVPGFMSGPHDDVRLPFSVLDPVVGDVFSILWEPDMMGETGNAIRILTSEVLTQVGQQVLAMTVMTALLSALQWPIMLTKLGYLIDNPWSNALDRAKSAGKVLADILLNRRLGVRPASLVGYSLGARVIFYALVELAKKGAYGVVQEVYLFGATLTASRTVWRQVRGVVAGRFVNAFAMNDWVLGYLFRATSGGLNTVAGLRPIEHIPDLENVDVTHLVLGHMSYRELMPVLLKYVGFKVTADHFDDPQDYEKDAPDREVITEEEAQRRAEEKERKGIKGLFKRRGQGKTTPNGSNAGSAPMSRAGSNETSRTGDEDEDLPPRLSTHASTANKSSSSHLTVQPEASRSNLSVEDSARPSFESTASGGGDLTPSTTPGTPALGPGEGGAQTGATGYFDIDALRAEVSKLPRHQHADAADAAPSAEAALAGQNETTTMTMPVPSARAIATADLSKLDDELDARELLRRQWAGETVSASKPLDPSFIDSVMMSSSTSDSVSSPSAAHVHDNDDDESDVNPFARAGQVQVPSFSFADESGDISNVFGTPGRANANALSRSAGPTNDYKPRNNASATFDSLSENPW